MGTPLAAAFTFAALASDLVEDSPWAVAFTFAASASVLVDTEVASVLVDIASASNLVDTVVASDQVDTVDSHLVDPILEDTLKVGHMDLNLVGMQFLVDSLPILRVLLRHEPLQPQLSP